MHSLNLNRCPPPFERAEYLGRVARVRAAMAAAGIDRLLVSGAAGIAWLTGYDGDSDYVPQLAVIDDQRDCTLYLRDMDLSGALHMSWLDPSDLIGYPEDHVGAPDRDGYDFILAQLRSSGRASGRIGAFLGRLPASVVAKFAAALPDAQLFPADTLIDWVRIVKSPAEVAVMREAARLTDHAMAAAYAVIAPGVLEAHAAAVVSAALIQGPNGIVGDRVISPTMPASTRSGTAHLRWSEECYRSSGSVNLEFGGSRYGYCAALMRTISLGSPDKRLLRVHDASLEGLEAALAVVRPGAVCGEVAEAYTRATARHGVVKESRCGYAIGLHWLEPTASLRKGDLTELREGMTFHLMLGNWMARDFGYVLSETFLVTSRGAECLTATDRTLCVRA